MSQRDAAESTAAAVGTWELLDFDRVMATANTWEGIESALLAIPKKASSPNAIATLVAPNGDTLSIGIASSLAETIRAWISPWRASNSTRLPRIRPISSRSEIPR